MIGLPKPLRVVLLVVTAALTPAGRGQDLPISTVVDLVRADLAMEKTGIVAQVMDLSEDEADAFWEVYREYDARMAEYWKARLSVIETYADHYDDLDPDVLEELAAGALQQETLRYALRVEFFARMRAATSANTAFRFFQLENQLLAVLDFQISSQLPFFPKPAPPQ